MFYEKGSFRVTAYVATPRIQYVLYTIENTSRELTIRVQAVWLNNYSRDRL